MEPESSLPCSQGPQWTDVSQVSFKTIAIETGCIVNIRWYRRVLFVN